MTHMSYVDNSVEIGDFFIFFVYFLTKSSEKLWISRSIKIYVAALKSFYSYSVENVLYFFEKAKK